MEGEDCIGKRRKKKGEERIDGRRGEEGIEQKGWEEEDESRTEGNINNHM